MLTRSAVQADLPGLTHAAAGNTARVGRAARPTSALSAGIRVPSGASARHLKTFIAENVETSAVENPTEPGTIPHVTETYGTKAICSVSWIERITSKQYRNVGTNAQHDLRASVRHEISQQSWPELR